MGARAKTYRRLNNIPEDWGTAVNVQAMVFGNRGTTSATGVAFTRDPATGERLLYGEFLINAQGEDVVAGIRTPQSITKRARLASGSKRASMEEAMPEAYAELKRIGHTLRPLEIVVVNTAAGARYGEDDYIDTGCGMGRAATLWMLERGVRLVGTDGWSWDAPFSHTRRKVAETGDASLIWEGHRAGREIGYSHLEKLHNLEQLPSTGFTVSCFPVKIERASAGWTRAVAILDG
jgi:kynurenine formamidase